MKDYTAHYPYGDYKYLIQTKGFAYNKFHDDYMLDRHHAKYAALDVIALQDTIDGVYSHLHTLQNEHLRFGSVVCFMSDYVTPVAIN